MAREQIYVDPNLGSTTDAHQCHTISNIDTKEFLCQHFPVVKTGLCW